MVVIAVHAHQRRAVDLGVENLGGLEIGRNQDVGLQPQARSVCRHRIGQVAGRGAANRIESEGLRIGQRHRDHAILEAQRGHADGVVLDVEIAARQSALPAAEPAPAASGRMASAEHSCRPPAAARGSATCSAGPGRSFRG